MPNADEHAKLVAIIVENAELAAEKGRRLTSRPLDFSAQSMGGVDAALMEAHYMGFPEESLDSIAHLMRDYILETAYRLHGGVFYWDEENDQPRLAVGEPLFSVALMPGDKVKKRLGGDESESVEFLYERFAAR